ncbi:MAG: ribosome maturation factor RimM [bacterium]|nr:ribosome maturation factor RimM [bacterium]
MKDLFILAEILRPHGLRGEVVVRLLTDHLETLTDAARIYLGLEAVEPVKVEGIRTHKGNPLIKLAGTNDREGAFALKGQMICVPREELVPLEEGEYFLHDLVGLILLDHLGNKVGPVENIMDTGGPPILTGSLPDGGEFMIPFAPGTIDEVDLEKGTIRIVDLPGLIE